MTVAGFSLRRHTSDVQQDWVESVHSQRSPKRERQESEEHPQWRQMPVDWIESRAFEFGESAERRMPP